jgi:hypothetical protein
MAFLAAWAALARAADSAREIAPAGIFRNTFFGGNPTQGRVDPKTGANSGPVKELAARTWPGDPVLRPSMESLTRISIGDHQRPPSLTRPGAVALAPKLKADGPGRDMTGRRRMLPVS